MILTVSVDGLLLPAAFNCLGLIGQNHSGLYVCLRRPVVESLNNGKDNPADIRKQTAVVAEVRPQDAWYRENELSMRQTQQQMIPHVLRKQESPFLRAGGAEVEGLTRKWAKVFILAFGIGALDAGDTLGVARGRPARKE